MSTNQSKPLTLQWNKLTLEAIKLSNTSPPLAARVLAMVHTAMYNAWSVFYKNPVSTDTALCIKLTVDNDSIHSDIQQAISYAAFRILTDSFCALLPAKSKSMFHDVMCRLDYDPHDTSLDISTPQGIGNLAARLVLEHRKGDGSNPHGTLQMPAWTDYTGYRPVNTWDKVNDLNYWQPLRTEGPHGGFKIQNFLVPHWGLVKPFALIYNWQFRPMPPYRKHEAQFKEQVKETISISAGLTDKQKSIAEYWADGPGTYTPPGHWCEIAQFIAECRKYDDYDCIKLFFALCNALHDAAVACWECKRYYDAVRPVTAVRELYRGTNIEAWGGPHKGKQTIKGENWQPYIATPPFAAHVSGHSAFSKAAAVILKCYTGSDHFDGCTAIKKGASAIEPGTTPKQDITLEWPTFADAAEQAGMSRLYGGIHFTKANKDGQTLGENIGRNAWQKAMFYFND